MEEVVPQIDMRLNPRVGLAQGHEGRYAGSLKKSSDASPSRRTTTARGEIHVMAHQILARRTTRMP
jgi:hypothetical protein